MSPLETSQSVRFWRSRDELDATEEFQQFLRAEFPAPADVSIDRISRREMLRLMAASIAFAGFTGCTRGPAETIVPYVRAPEDFVPGRPLFFATAMPLGGFSTGVLVESHLGRPTKVEGNPDHPASLGATDVFAQASILTFYDPDRSSTVLHRGQISSWGTAAQALNDAVIAQRDQQGAGLRILTGRITSPTLADQIRSVLTTFPRARWHQYEAVTHANLHAGMRLAFGADGQARHRVDRADVIVSLESDFLGTGPAHLSATRQFASRRAPDGDQAMNRLYVVESTPSITGSMADHRLRLASRDVARTALALARAVEGHSGEPGNGGPSSHERAFIAAAAADLRQHRGTGLVIAGESQPPVVHALAHVMNASLDNAGSTVEYTGPVEADPSDDMQSLRELVADMQRGSVQLLLILGGNPAFDAPHDLRFGEQLSRVGLAVHQGLYADETAAACEWHIPEPHYLEAWGDTRAFDGTVSIVQPLIAPLYDSRSAHELLSILNGDQQRTGYDAVREYWSRQMAADEFADRWQRALNTGLISDTALPAQSLSAITSVDALAASIPAEPANGLELVFRPDPTIWDGRFANNGWLQELPKPLTKLTWDAAALVSPATAARLGLSNNDVVELTRADASVRAPVWVLPGQADESIAITFGYGHSRGGRIARNLGFNAYALRTSDAPWVADGLTVSKTSDHYQLVSTQHHFSMEGRDLIHFETLEEFRRRAGRQPPTEDAQSLYPPVAFPGHLWGMTIDLNTCIGCGACTVACQAENNIPVVGKEEVARGREMHWIRVDRYFGGDLNDPAFTHQPVPCMHCENAPCELVCPVGATVHSDEGINQMVYNRCVGTRYCSNNCPYKVRRFNFFQYADWTTPSLKGLRNPDVTVRSRGVMEKCTYCIQRINRAKIDAEVAERPLRDGDVVTACQAVCPSRAIVFGDLHDRDSRVATLRSDTRNYALLSELNTRTRTTYLARVRNAGAGVEGGNGVDRVS